ncbi:MAG: hypothetical protein ACRELF_29755, partial [Gemmataceae bacterium]
MSNNPTDTGRRRVVVAPRIAPSTDLSWMQIIPVWIASAVVNLAIVGLAAALFSLLGTVWAGTPQDSDPVRTTQVVEEQPKEDFDLTDDTIGINSGMPLDLKVDRVSDVVVPGILDPTQAEGIPDAPPDALRSNVTPPPGASGLGSAFPNLNNVPGIAGPGSSFTGMGGPSLKNQLIGRGPSAIQGLVDKYGGNKASEAAVARGLKWLALHQAQDGHWSLHEFHKYAREKPRPAGKIIRCNCEAGTAKRNDVAATGLGLLPFLGAGITHKPATTTQKDYLKTVEG